jgi:enoyl-CoA hydratase/carnithine racemase
MSEPRGSDAGEPLDDDAGEPVEGEALESPVVLETVGQTRIVLLNRPQARNALTLPMLSTARAAFDDASANSAIRCVILGGTGGHFCAGADLRASFTGDPAFMDRLDVYLDEFHSLIKSVVRCDKPTIAMMDGAAVGFGADLALGCDLRVAATSAYAQEKFVQIGLMPDGGGTFWLPRLVGAARALQLMLLGDRIDVAELHRLGVVAQLVESVALRDATLALARRLESGPPLALAAIKHAVVANMGSLDEALGREREGQLRLLRSADAMEGVAAWAERRAPRFQGR